MLSRIRQAAAALFAPSESPEAYGPYEGANRSSTRNPIPSGSPTDKNVELDSFTRDELVKSSRYIAKNTGFAREQIGTMALYSVGDGLRVKPQRGSKAWRDRAFSIWEDWSEVADLSGRFSLEECEKMVCRAIDEDGEVFIHKTRNKAGSPRIQIIESHRVGPWGDPGDTVDGVKFDSKGVVTHYRVLDGDSFRDIPASNILHVFDPESYSLVRNAPKFSHASNHLRDEIELLALEKYAVKEGADVVRTLTADDATDPDNDEFSALDDVEDDSEPTDPRTLQKLVGGKTVRLKRGEKLENYESKRPNSTFVGFIDHLRRDSAQGHVPYEFSIKPGDVNGAAVRLVVTRADRLFTDRQGVLRRRMVIPLWKWVIGDAINRKLLRSTPEWWKVKIGTPRRVTVDAGRETKENRADVLAGLKCLGDHFDENGKDFEEEMEQRASELATIKSLAEKYGLDPEIIFEGMKKPSLAAKPEDGDDDEKGKVDDDEEKK